MIAGKGFGSGKIFTRCIIFDVIKMPGVIVSREFNGQGRHTISYIIKVPLIVAKEGVRLDFLNSFVTKARGSEIL